MLIVGAKGHAKEIIEIIKENHSFENLHFFDNISKDVPEKFFGYPVLRNFIEVESLFNRDNSFCLGIGGTFQKFQLTQKFLELGGVLKSVNSKSALVAEDASIAPGCNIMPFAAVFNDADLEEGSLVNSYASIHHDSFIGKYTEISPGARILGRCHVGSFCSIGTNAVILPKVKICNEVILGAGSVVIKDITQSGTYAGVPAKKIK